jgi:hypothetical protein
VTTSGRQREHKQEGQPEDADLEPQRVPIRAAIPAAMISAPDIVTPRPNLGSSRAAAPEATNTPTENGMKVAPEWRSAV